jgi:hypothetical protein
MSDKFYLGKLFDPAQAKATEHTVQYDPADLTTHAVVTGMTGSGKTGLCIALMEEAALNGVPAILIDPKGDLTNLLLHFPELAPQDFQPWLDPELARRSGKTIEQAANDAALSWRNGLAEWGISHERMLALKNAADFAIYTPGSDAGIPHPGWSGPATARSWGSAFQVRLLPSWDWWVSTMSIRSVRVSISCSRIFFNRRGVKTNPWT